MPTMQMGVYWDYENVRLPAECAASQAANRVRQILVQLEPPAAGCQLCERRLYYDSSKPTELGTNRSGLDLAGFSLVDCPTRNRKETLDKKIIVDIMHSAMLARANNQCFGVTLISSDGDYAYMLNRLRDMGVFVVLIHSGLVHHPPITPAFLIDSADVVLHWRTQVLQVGETVPRPVRPATVAPQRLQVSSSASDAVAASGGEASSSASAAAAPGGAEAAAAAGYADGFLDGAGEAGRSSDIADAFAETDPGDGTFDLFLVLVQQGGQSKTGWATDASVSAAYYRSIGHKDSVRLSATRQECLNRGYLLLGRRRLMDSQIVLWEEASAAGGFAPEMYLRLTPEGLQVLQRPITVD